MVITMIKLKNNKKAKDSQVKIYKSLRRILLTKQLSDVTVADISSECGISRSTFYRNYNNVIEVLELMLDYFYNRYLEQKVDKPDQLLFFFQYWINHRDLINIISTQNESILKDCMKRYEKDESKNPYLLDLRVSILSSILCNWSNLKKNTPEEMKQMTMSILNKKCIDILLDNI